MLDSELQNLFTLFEIFALFPINFTKYVPEVFFPPQTSFLREICFEKKLHFWDFTFQKSHRRAVQTVEHTVWLDGQIGSYRLPCEGFSN